MFSQLFAAAVFTSLAYAQSLSVSCTGALAAVAANPDASSCLNLQSLLPILASGDSSIIPPINTWLTNICSAAPCSNTTLAAVTTNITTGCDEELSIFGASSVSTQEIIGAVQEFYPTVRQILCLRDGDTNCIVKTLNGLQGAVGTLSVNNIINIIGSGTDATIPSSVICSSCAKAAYNIVKKDQPSLIAGADDDIQGECGASFLDGVTPSTISQSASNNFKKSAATFVNPSAVGVMSMILFGVTALVA